MAEPSPMLRVDRVSKIYAHDGQSLGVLRDVSLEVRAGEMLTVVGASGAGKSTLLHLIGTLDEPTSGAIWYGDTDVTRMTNNELARFRNQTLGFVFQFHHLLPEFNALENVMMPGLIQNGRRNRDRAHELLNAVGLGHRLSHRPSELSGGEQQRVALARALFNRPQLVLADEPTGNLDSHTSDAMHDLFFELNEMQKTTFLIVTHNVQFADRMPRVVRMVDGSISSDTRTACPSAPPSAENVS